MIKNGKFNTDTIALIKRIQAHKKHGLYDLNKWIFGHINLIKGLSILDLGCGIGKQTLPMAQIIGEKGHIVALDISQEALDILLQGAEKLGLEKRISTLHVGLDEFDDKHFQAEYFDRALSCYSLYYAEDARSIFKKIHYFLKTGGILFFCGPARNNNFELKQFHYSLLKEKPPSGGEAAIFMEEISQQLTRVFFTKVEVFTFQNPLQFDSADALYDYWSSYNLYDKNLDEKFKAAVADYFKNNSKFKTVKRIIGVKAIK